MGEAEEVDAAAAPATSERLPAALAALRWWRVPPTAWERGERSGSLWYAAAHPPHVVAISDDLRITEDPLDEATWSAIAEVVGAEASWPPSVVEARSVLARISETRAGEVRLVSRTALEAAERHDDGPLFGATVAVDDAASQGWWGAPTDGRALPASMVGIDTPTHLEMRGPRGERRPHVRLGADRLPADGLHLMWWHDGPPAPGRGIPEHARTPVLLRPSLLWFILAGVLASFIIPVLRGMADYVGRGWPNLLFGGLFAGAALALFAGLLWRPALPVWVPDGATSMRPLGPDEDLNAHLSSE